MNDLSGKVALVTGSTRGIGRAIAKRLAAAGADVAVHGRSPDGPSRAAAEDVCETLRALGRKAHPFAADIANKDEVAALMDAVGSELGGLDVLVLNAARAPFKETTRLLERDLRALVETNLFGHVFCVQKALPLLARDGGRIVFISSLGSRFMSPQYPLGPMKAAMEAMVRQWAEELRPQGIGANGICAGLVKTDAYKTLRRLWPGLEALPEDAFVTPDEVAAVVAFLASPAAGAISGQTLVVDRGLSNRILRPPAPDG
jgi:NAD(P)-dependent dehydrogenase (short-subunit alcohol dehydrogenase family)